jgi:hypothetical protein
MCDSRQSYLLSALLVCLAATASAGGLWLDGLYRDSPYIVPQARGQDAVTFAVSLPLLVVALVWSRQGSPRAKLLWLGQLAYLLYAYATYAFGAAFNEFFLFYVAILGLSLFALIGILLATNADDLAQCFRPGRISRLTGAFLVAVGVSGFALWLKDIVPANLAHQVPESIKLLGTPTNVIYVLDLSVTLPTLILTGVLLLRGRPWGYVLGGMMLVMGSTLMLAVLVMAIFMHRAGLPLDLFLVSFFATATVTFTLLSVVFIARFKPVREAPSGLPQR